MPTSKGAAKKSTPLSKTKTASTSGTKASAKPSQGKVAAQGLVKLAQKGKYKGDFTASDVEYLIVK